MNIVSEQEKEILEETVNESDVENVSEASKEEQETAASQNAQETEGAEEAKEKKGLGKKKKSDKKTEAYEAKIAELDVDTYGLDKEE